MFALLFAAHTLFLWMFLAAEGLERMAEAGRISGSLAVDTKAIAYGFAAEWRHGMAGGWPLYMPGFFATAIATWVWSCGRPLRRLLAEGITVMALAALTAKLFAHIGTRYIIEAFEHQTNLQCEGVLLGSTVVGSGLGLYTLLTWSTVIIAGQRAVASRSVWPLWLPVVLNVVLAQIRPWTVGDFTELWGRRVLQGDGVAIISLLLVPSAAAFLVWYQLKLHHALKEQTSPQRQGAEPQRIAES
ncbi:MAG: hypothetical protein H0T92_13510 [Pyrinomonadaceae bacterium]|nr:hypothetical protein [Pyrinomonadaceae bacterium]